VLAAGEYVTNHANDKQELDPAAGSVDKEVYQAETVSADTGFFSEEAVKGVEKRDGNREAKEPIVYRAAGKQSHHRTVKDIERHEEPAESAEEAEEKEVMKRAGSSAKRGGKVPSKSKNPENGSGNFHVLL
jgi:hypothetical protein